MADLPMQHDTMMQSAFPTTNYGSALNLFIGERNDTASVARSLFRPDFSSLPVEAIITSAILKLTITGDNSDNARTMRVYRSLQDWVEAQATWNIYSTGNNWNTAGSGGAGTDYDASELGNISLTASESGQKSITLDATEVQKLFDGTYTNNGFFVKMDTETNDAYLFASTDNATPASRPILVVTYTEAGAVVQKPQVVFMM